MDDFAKLNRLKREEAPGLFRGWSVPGFLEIRGNSLAYRQMGGFDVRKPDRDSMDRLLKEFVLLAAAPKEDVLRFAQRWGVLGLCKHGFPATHKITISKQVSLLPIFKYCDVKNRQDWCYESLERWRYYARQVSAIASLAYMPSILEPGEANPEDRYGINIWPGSRVEIQGLPGDEEDWKALFGDMWFNFLKSDRVIAARHLITLAIERLFTMTHIRPAFIWQNRKPDFHFCGRSDKHGLFESIVMQLMLNVSGSRGFSVCRECLNSFLIDQTHRSASYCPECNKKIQHRQATQRHYQKDKENPNRKKHKRLSTSERESIASQIAEAKEQGGKFRS